MDKQIKSSDWLIKGKSKEELAEKKAKAIEEAENELREKQIEEMSREMLEISVNANVEPVLEINGKEIVLSENSTIILNNILEQAFIPYIAEHLYKQGYTKQEWISVEDRLPNVYEEVLVYRPYGTVNFEVYTYLGDNKWEDNMGYVDYTEEEFITNWQPLPQPPKMKGAE